MDSSLPDWEERIKVGGQPSAVEAREKGYRFSDNQIFEAVVKAILSNSTDYSKVERVLPELTHLFKDFNLAYYSGLSESDIDQVFVPWFKARSAGSLTMRRDLTNLIRTATMLREHSARFGSLEGHFSSLLRTADDDCIELACKIGSVQSQHKLPAMGIPIAAEMLKNIGYDVAKPDRHIKRAMGCFGMVRFSKWKDQSAHRPPEASETEMMEVMRSVARFARTINVRVSFLDNTIWLLCAKGGLYFNNEQLCRLGGKPPSPVNPTNKAFQGKAAISHPGPKTVGVKRWEETSMETLAEFVVRLSQSIECYSHFCNSGIFSLKKVDTDIKGRMGVFAWVSELKRKAIFRVGTDRDLAELAGVSELANGEKPRQDWNKTGVFFCVNKGSTDEDYQKAVRALRAIFLLNPP
jgi:endonuclease III